MDNLDNIAAHFPLLNRLAPCGTPLIYLDSAATALKPQCVIDAVNNMLASHTANIHRSVHFLGDEATEAYESVRDIVAYFLNTEANEIVFVRNATEALNIVANGYNLNGNRIVSSYGEHHSNYLPWTDNVYRLAIDACGQINLDELQCELAKGDVALVSLSHVSNVTGNILDIKEVIEISHQYGAKVLIDAAQSASHIPIDVTELDCDFLVFSGHKLGSPTGVGVLFGKAHLLEEMDLFLKGGSTIEEVTTSGFVVKNAPWKFEAGTPAIESVVGLGAAINFLLEIGMDNVQRKFKQLSLFTEKEIQLKIPQAVILGASQERSSGPYSFYINGMSSHLLARGLSDRYGICVRSGFHCAQPLHQQLNTPPSLRISFWIYNTKAEISKAIEGIATLFDVAKR
jgi:cysteine desulfurase/selenocysteine lyase